MSQQNNYLLKNGLETTKKPLSAKNTQSNSNSMISNKSMKNQKNEQNVRDKEITKQEFDEYIKSKRRQSDLQQRAQTAKQPTTNAKPQTPQKEEKKKVMRDVQSAVQLNQPLKQNNNNIAELPQIQRKYQLPAYSATTTYKESEGKGSQFFDSVAEVNSTKNNNKMNRNLSAISKFTLKQFSMQKQQSSKQAPPLITHLEPEDENYDDLRDKLWDQVYFTKNQINELTQDNNNLRAKVWNFEKENRKMIKQIENWNLNKGVIFDEENKPFVDSVTSEKVFTDQNFQAISMKKEIKQLQEDIYEQDIIIKDLKIKIKNTKEDSVTMKDQYHEALKDTLISSKIYRLEQNKTNNPVTKKLENLEYRKELLKESIREMMEKNRVQKFMIEVQQQTYEKSLEELKIYKEKLERKESEEEQLVNELKERIPSDQLNDMPQKNQRKQQNKINSVAIQKNIDEQIEEKDVIIEEQLKDISKINYDIQEISRNSILEKQDLMKEINDYKEWIQSLEEKYLILQSRHSKRVLRSQQKSIFNASLGLTYFGSEGQSNHTIKDIPDYIVKENNIGKNKNPLNLN